MSMIVVFDAHCLICSGWVRFLLQRDRRGELRFASMQTPAGQSLLARAGLDAANPESLLLVVGDRTYQDTAAIFRILHYIGGLWRLAWVGWLIPAPLRDALYRHLARNRYRWFGRSDTCFLPNPEYAGRFIE